MNIIWGEESLCSLENIDTIKDKYIVLELDTYYMTVKGIAINAYAVLSVEDIPLPTFPNLEHFKNMHDKLLENYRKKNFEFVVDMADQLSVRFGADMKEYYAVMADRANYLKNTDLPDDWRAMWVPEKNATI